MAFPAELWLIVVAFWALVCVSLFVAGFEGV
jgi:hypothetical protein